MILRVVEKEAKNELQRSIEFITVYSTKSQRAYLKKKKSCWDLLKLSSLFATQNINHVICYGVRHIIIIILHMLGLKLLDKLHLSA